MMMRATSSSPSVQDIWKWTFTRDAIAPCFIRDVLSMKEAGVDADFFWIGHTPCRSVNLVGMVVAVQVHEKRTIYTLDDGTGVVDCILRHPAPAKPAAESKDMARPPSSKKPKSGITPLEPPIPVTEVGYVVRVVGKVVRHYETRQIIADSIEPCASVIDEADHWIRVVELHKSKYSLAAPFVIPSPTEPIRDNVDRQYTDDTSVSSTRVAHNAGSYALASRGPPPQARAPLSPGPSIYCVLYAPSKIKLRHPSRLRSCDLTSNIFRLHLKHYMDNVRVNPQPDLSHNHRKKQASHLQRTPMMQRMDYDCDTYGDLSPMSEPPHGFTLSHLRRLAARVVRAEARRRAKVEQSETRRRAKTQPAMLSTGAASAVSTGNSIRVPTSKRDASPRDPFRAKKKRLFEWALARLYEEGGIVLWDGPVHPLPLPVSTSEARTENSLWSESASSKSSTSAISVPLTSVSVSRTSGRGTEEEDMNEYLSDPQPNEDAYVSLTPELLSTYVEEAATALKRGKGRGGGRREPTPEEVAAYLRRTDARWARVGAWAVKEALEALGR
ncbi:hypothetical protein F5J12DRAFT_814028 [Pisolithus orientalis]|uniref:uncharacterized protein n=1 Tax=Pisolithus orientalis TaxID=936130 RepID=UPI00222564C8|nr:uncharacterized protein F5J12DRAFT_814028 [Pisolithus orientalis]KAI6019902.1 hypothetical protein F5J12DRAFT_814028 [Pisolithus orientalis]